MIYFAVQDSVYSGLVLEQLIQLDQACPISLGEKPDPWTDENGVQWIVVGMDVDMEAVQDMQACIQGFGVVIPDQAFWSPDTEFLTGWTTPPPPGFEDF